MYKFNFRWSDFDSHSLLNNAASAEIVNTARVYFFNEILDSVRPNQLVLKVSKFEFINPIKFTTHCFVDMKIVKLGHTSISSEYYIYINNHVRIRAEAIQVYVDYKTFEPLAIPENLRILLSAKIS